MEISIKKEITNLDIKLLDSVRSLRCRQDSLDASLGSEGLTILLCGEDQDTLLVMTSHLENSTGSWMWATLGNGL